MGLGGCARSEKIFLTKPVIEYYLLSISGNSGEQAKAGREGKLGIPEIVFVLTLKELRPKQFIGKVGRKRSPTAMGRWRYGLSTNESFQGPRDPCEIVMRRETSLTG